MRRLAIVVLCMAITAGTTGPAVAQPADAARAAPLEFRDAGEARRFRALVSELRCVMCQNQSLADSDALIAHELRSEVLELMRSGMDDAAIRAHLVDRYGEFVLYRPRVGPGTWLLWFGPVLLLAAGGWLVWRLVGAQQRGRPPVPEDEGQEW